MFAQWSRQLLVACFVSARTSRGHAAGSWSANGIPPVALAINPKGQPTHGLGIAGPFLFLEVQWTRRKEKRSL